MPLVTAPKVKQLREVRSGLSQVVNLLKHSPDLQEICISRNSSASQECADGAALLGKGTWPRFDVVHVSTTLLVLRRSAACYPLMAAADKARGRASAPC